MKRAISLFLSLLLMLSTIMTVNISAYATTSGKCGKNAKWSYNAEDAILTISGKGDMYNYKTEEDAPWYNYVSSEYGNVKVIIENGITSIGSYSFSDYYYDYNNFTIPSSVNRIKANAFMIDRGYYIYEQMWENGQFYISNCLVQVYQYELPDNLVIKEGTKVIQDNLFNCCSIKSVRIPKSLTSIPDQCFSNCEELSSISFNGKIKYIGNDAFYNTGFKKFVIPDGVIEIGDVSFGYCYSLTSITIPKTVKKIGDAFLQWSDVKHIYYKGTKSDWNKIKIGKDNFFESIKIHYTSPKCSAVLNKTSYTYNGKVQTPSVTVKNSKGKTLKKNTDYTVKYAKGRKNVGKYAVKITFKGKYSGSKTLYYTIKPKATSISKLTAGKKKFTVKWKKLTTQTTGYQIQYGTSSKFKSAKTVAVSKNKTTSKTISKLKAKKKYYVRIRTYKTVKVNGKNTKIYSSWSKAKAVKTK